MLFCSWFVWLTLENIAMGFTIGSDRCALKRGMQSIVTTVLFVFIFFIFMKKTDIFVEDAIQSQYVPRTATRDWQYFWPSHLAPINLQVLIECSCFLKSFNMQTKILIYVKNDWQLCLFSHQTQKSSTGGRHSRHPCTGHELDNWMDV